MSSDQLSTVKKLSLILESPIGFLIPLDMEIPDAMITLGELVPSMHHLTDGIVSLAIANCAKTGKKISCKAGCSMCCSQLIPLSVPEVFFIMDKIRYLPKQQQMRTIDRFKEVYQVITDRGMMEKLEAITHTSMKSSADLSAVGREYFGLNCPCPFLEDNRCAVYDFRPIICREYSVTSDAKNCADPFTKNVEILNLHESRINDLADVAQRVLSKPRTLVPLPLIFDWYQDNLRLSKVERSASELFEDLFIRIMKMKPAEKRSTP
jgi:Fe-S-cluster containining protein